MKIQVEQHAGWTVLHLEGPLDATTASETRIALLETLKDGTVSFLLDLEKVRTVDSSGLATLVRFYKEIRTRGGTLALCAVQEEAMRIFHLTRLDTIFTILPDSPDTARAA